MIRFEAVTKRFPGADGPAVDGLDLDVPEGRTCVLLGPSGCGKSTTLRLINRLVEPDRGRILLDGRDVARTDPVALRRRIGYVLQGIGLFPHRSVAGNVATVPELLGWPRPRIAERVDALLTLVGLDPATYRDRRPASLSGGQRQRVGVARALAADPPVLLMDEPFGAVDPIARTRLQGEIAGILARLRKTVVIVTHDLGEAMLMADQVALMRDGRLVQVGAPSEMLAAPADAFVADFLCKDRGLRRLALVTADEVAEPGTADGEAVAPAASLQQALSAMLETGRTRLVVGAASDMRVVTLDAIRRVARLVSATDGTAERTEAIGRAAPPGSRSVAPG